MNTQVSVSREDALEILFADRNRAYGAYQLRRQYPATLARAFGIGLLLIGLMLAIPHIMKAFSALLPAAEKDDGERITTTVILTPPPPQPPVPSTPPPVARSTQRFVPPVVDLDENVTEEPPKLTNDDLLKDPSDIGTTTVDVPVEAAPSLDDPGLGSVIETTVPSDNDATLETFDVQRPPNFPGGEAELMRYLAENIRYPDIAREANIQGPVVLSFVIGKDGSINDVTILRELGGGCSKEAVRVVKSMPKWTPGESNGRSVKVRCVLPVRFQLR